MKDCWITPSGSVVNVAYMGHNDYAIDYLRNKLGNTGYKELRNSNFSKSAYEYLHDRGWIRVKAYSGRLRILGNCIDGTKIMRNTMEPSMNTAQMREARNICIENGVDILDALNV